MQIVYDGGLSSVAEMIEKDISDAARKSAEEVCQRARSLCNYEVRDDISVLYGDKGAEVRVDNSDALAIEFGTTDMPAKPFLVPSLIGEKNNFVEKITDVIKMWEDKND